MMGQSNFLDEIDCGSFFDHIDDLIDFPGDDVFESAAGDAVPHEGLPFAGDIWPTLCNSLPPSSDLSAELSVPYEDIVQLEWLSNFVDDSFSGGSMEAIGGEASSAGNNHLSVRRQFQTASPVSVLESSSSCSGEKTSPRSPEVAASSRCGRARSKRPRPATFIPRPTPNVDAPFIFTPKAVANSDNFAESRLVLKIPKQALDEQKKKKKKLDAAVVLSSSQDVNQQPVVRKCMHCEITKTPQWRAGPMGPKTLCNACGVRFKSGRLFPEYRPAASPTFVPSQHSNSHKKVLEMRNKVSVVGVAPSLVPNKSSVAM